MSKADYVREAPFIGGHLCHWPGCTAQVKPAVWGCRKHWNMLPKRLRDKIWATYWPGQEINKKPSGEYLEVIREVGDWIAKEGPL